MILSNRFVTRVRQIPYVLALVLAFLSPTQAKAQVLPVVVGGVGGLLVGSYITTGSYVLKSRSTGWVMHSVEHLLEPSPEIVPLVVAPAAGMILGYRSTSALASAGIWGGVGLVGGGAVGAAVGHLIWDDPEGRWAGGVIGSAAGLLLGVVLGASFGGSGGSAQGSESESPPASFSIRVPWGGER